MIKEILEKDGFICDMDGVIYHGNVILDGVREFVNWLIENNKKFVFLTNSPEKTPHELSMKLERMGLVVSADHFYTSAMATAEFLHSQNPGCTAYVIGEAALTKALYDRSIYMNDHAVPDAESGMAQVGDHLHRIGNLIHDAPPYAGSMCK